MSNAAPDPAVAASDALVRLLERPKQSLDVGRAEPDPAVGHGDDQPDAIARRLLAGDVELDGSALRELHRIVDEVLERGPQAHRIADHGCRKILRDGHAAFDILALGARIERSRE